MQRTNYLPSLALEMRHSMTMTGCERIDVSVVAVLAELFVLLVLGPGVATQPTLAPKYDDEGLIKTCFVIDSIHIDTECAMQCNGVE